MNAVAALRSAYRPAIRYRAPTHDFLIPAFSKPPQNASYVSSTPSSTTSTSETFDPAPKSKPQAPLSEQQHKFLDSALRVNQAGELAATLIYSAQTPLIIKSHPHLRPLMQHMYSQEATHLSTFNALLARHRIRPTAMYPLWKIAATALGWGTAMLGREAAMACTEAVETEIGEHYNGQVRELLAWMRDVEERGEEVGEELKGLTQTLKRIRDEELEHLDTAVVEDAKKAGGYEVLNWVVRGGCRGAIWISERV